MKPRHCCILRSRISYVCVYAGMYVFMYVWKRGMEWARTLACKKWTDGCIGVVAVAAFEILGEVGMSNLGWKRCEIAAVYD